MEKIRILIADDHDVVRLGISRVISEQPDMMVAAARIFWKPSGRPTGVNII
ncbi:MAG: hypothetical protein V1793_11285 [Pseudomonadota bacterium]